MISLIVAVDEALGMGNHNQLLCHLPVDLRHFKQTTWGKPIIMGRNTFDSIGRPLPGRLNLVLSRRMLPMPGIQVVRSLQEAFSATHDAPEVVVIGGRDVFQQTLSMVERIYLTKIHHVFDADVFFEAIDWVDWKLTEQREQPSDENNPHDVTFYQYDRVLPRF